MAQLTRLGARSDRHFFTMGIRDKQQPLGCQRPAKNRPALSSNAINLSPTGGQGPGGCNSDYCVPIFAFHVTFSRSGSAAPDRIWRCAYRARTGTARHKPNVRRGVTYQVRPPVRSFPSGNGQDHSSYSRGTLRKEEWAARGGKPKRTTPAPKTN